jgi:antitoxin (DNA-binding transcriptional repressor) of toxin-antitoxin stability system
LHASYSPAVVEEEQVEMNEVETNVADVVESVKDSKVIYITNSGRIEKISALLAGVTACTTNEEVLERIEIIEGEIEGLREAVNSDDTEILMEAETAPVAEVPVFDAEAEGRAQAVAEAKAKEAKMAEEAELARLAAVAKQIRKDALASQARELGL